MREGWVYKKLGEVCEFKAGFTPKQNELLDHGVYPYFKVAEMNLEGNELYLVKTKQYLNSSKKTFPKGAVVFPKNGGAIFTNKKRILAQDSIIDMNTQAVIANACLEYRYLYYLIKNIDFSNYVNGSALPTLALDRIKDISVPVFDRVRQQQIVSELDLLSHILDQKRQQLKEYDALAESIFYDMFGDPVENPKGWEVKTIGDLCTLKSGDSKANSAPEGKLPYVKVGDMNLPENSLFITCSSRYVDKEFCKKNIFPKGSVIFPKRGESIRTNKKRLTRIEICCDLNLMGVFSKTESLLPDYLYHFFLKIDFKEIVKESSTIPQLNNGEISPIRIPLPPLDLQRSFASKIESIEHQKQLLRASIKETEMLFQSRMDYWFNN